MAKFEKVTTPEFRVSFPKVFEPSAFPGQKPKYSIGMLIPKTVDISKLKAMMQKAVAEKWPDPTKRPKKLISAIKDGDTDVMDDGTLRCEKYPEIAGHWFISASSVQKPGLVDKNLQPIIDQAEFYAGCYAIATLTCFAYAPSKDRPQSKYGVSFGLQNIMKTRPGEAFSGRAKAEDDFAEVAGQYANVEGTATIAQEEEMFA